MEKQIFITYEKNKLFTDEGEMNCLQSCLFDISQRFAQPYECIFVGLWKFEIEKEISLGDEYDYSFQEINMKMMDNLCKYTDICYNVSSVIDVDSVIIGSRDLFLVELDTYDCPWSPGYLWKHFTYFIILIDRENEYYLAYSPYDSISNIHISDVQLKNAKNIFHFFKSENSTNELTIKEIQRCIQESTEQGYIFKKMETTFNCIVTYEDIHQLITSEKVENNLYVMRFAYFSKCRHCISLMIRRYISDSMIINLLCQSSELWSKLKYVVIRAILTSDIQKIADGMNYMEGIIQCEKEAYKRILEL